MFMKAHMWVKHIKEVNRRMKYSDYPAHIKVQQDGTEIIQTVAEHCKNTSNYAHDCLAPIGLGPAAKLAGLLHDMGKYTDNSREYQKKVAHGCSVRRGSVIHSFQCCRFLLEGHHNCPVVHRFP